jgi:hypothetical protein
LTVRNHVPPSCFKGENVDFGFSKPRHIQLFLFLPTGDIRKWGGLKKVIGINGDKVVCWCVPFALVLVVVGGRDVPANGCGSSTYF